MLNLILFGPPGAGKGTQAQKIVEKYNLTHLSTGDMLRSEIAAKSDLGMKAKEKMDKGELVPDEVVIGMIEKRIDQEKDTSGFIFDGFPRTTAQAKALDELLAKKSAPISTLVSLEVEKSELVGRLQKRGEIENRSDDQDLATVENRIRVYHENTTPVMEHYKAQGKYSPIDGMGGIDDIFGRISTELDKLK